MQTTTSKCRFNNTNSRLNTTLMKRNVQLFLLFSAFALPVLLPAQRLFTRDAKVTFDATSKGSPERVDALNKSGTLVLDIASSRVESAVLVSNFLFEKALMQEHFNENYMESSKFPKATFKGKIEDPGKVDFKQDGTYTPMLSGDLTIHGVTKPVKVPATITVKGGKVTATTTFKVALADYGIDIPSVVSDKLAKEAKITIESALEPMK